MCVIVVIKIPNKNKKYDKLRVVYFIYKAKMIKGGEHMTRGTTPTLKFTTPFTADQVESGYITFTTQRNILLDISVNDDSVKIEDDVRSRKWFKSH